MKTRLLKIVVIAMRIVANRKKYKILLTKNLLRGKIVLMKNILLQKINLKTSQMILLKF